MPDYSLCAAIPLPGPYINTGHNDDIGAEGRNPREHLKVCWVLKIEKIAVQVKGRINIIPFLCRHTFGF